MKSATIQNFKYPRPCASHSNCTETANLAVLTLEQSETSETWCMDKKSVIFVVDISVSMLDTMQSLKASIRTFRDLICGRKNSKQDPITDEKFRECLPSFHLITFSDDAKLRWSNADSTRTVSFDELVDSLDVENSTNMGAGIEMAYSLCPTSTVHTLQGSDARATWIVVLTDGESNRGKYQSKDAFSQLASEKPANTKIVSLGFGDDFNVDILDVIGNFTYLENRESIPSFMGAFVDEVSSCSIINVGISFPQRPSDEETDIDNSIIFGSRDIGWFSAGRKYQFGFIPKWEPPLSGEVVRLSSTEIMPDGIWHYQTTERVSNFPPPVDLTPEINSAIANAKASRFIKEIYACNSKNIQSTTRKILGIVETWTAAGEEEAREMVKRVCRDAAKAQNKINTPASLQLAHGLQNQTSYMIPMLQTPSSISSSQAATDLAQTYL